MPIIVENSTELYHYGRKGMKWYQNIYANHKAKKLRKKRIANLKKARETKATRQRDLAAGKIPVKKMTDAEIKKKVERLELEKRYADLKRDTDKAQSTRGKTFVNRYLDSTVEKLAEGVAADLTAQTAKTFLTKAINNTYGSEVVFTNNKKKG